MSSELRNLTAICLFFAILGLGFAGWGAYELWQTHVFVTTAEHTTGKVVAFELRSTAGHNTSVPYPVYEFTDHEKQVHRATSTTYSSSDSYSVGSSVAILYAPGDPSISRIGGFAHLNALALGFIGLGGLAILVSIGVFVSGYKSYKS